MEKNRDLLWMSKEYENFDLPKEKKYLLKYFKSDIQAAFLKYFFVFGNFDNFKEHTGFDCQQRWLGILQSKLEKIESMRTQARADMDMTLLVKIEEGKIKKL